MATAYTIPEPDTLQDLCVIYLINHLEYLNTGLSSLDDSCGDVISPFSTVLCSKLVDYYLKYHIPNKDTRPLVDRLFHKSLLCNSLCLNRRKMLTLENLKSLASSGMKYLDLTVFRSEESIHSELNNLIASNSNSLLSIRVCNKAEDIICYKLLESLCRQSSVESEIQIGPGDTSKCVDVATCKIPANTKFSTKASQSGSSDAADCTMIAVKTLKSFSYVTFYKSHKDEVSKHACVEKILKILESNKSLQSVTVVSSNLFPCSEYLTAPVLYNLCNLRSLILSCDESLTEFRHAPQHIFQHLPDLKQLQHLDVSFGTSLKDSLYEEHMMKYDEPTKEAFKKAVIQMPWLRSLDLSGTNLTDIVGHAYVDDAHSKEPSACTGHCMPGFEDRQFDFLGLFCSNASSHKHIPANRVSGHQSEDQLLVALWSHHHNKTIMYQVLKELLIQIKAEQSNLKCGPKIFGGLIAYLEHIPDWDLLNVKSAVVELKNVENIFTCMYYLLRYKTVQDVLTVKHRRKLLELVIVVCSNCARDLSVTIGPAKDKLIQISRLAMLLGLILDLERVSEYSYSFEKYMRMLMMLVGCNLDYHPLTIAAHQLFMLVLRLVHSACRMSQELKVLAGQKLKLVEVLLSRIATNLQKKGNVEALGKLWSIIWTLTDEVPVNCELFVAYGGCDKSLHSIDSHRDDDDLLRKVSGAMCNVSEVAHLRPLLMTEPLVKCFSGMLHMFNEDNYDITSHAAAYLVLLAADGPQAWTVQDPTRESVLKSIDELIHHKWDLHHSKGVKFRSLGPMLKQLENFGTPTAQYWGAWMICNLVIVKLFRGAITAVECTGCTVNSADPDETAPAGAVSSGSSLFTAAMYCPMVVEENGLEIIQRTLNTDGLREDVTDTLVTVRKITQEFKMTRR